MQRIQLRKEKMQPRNMASVLTNINQKISQSIFDNKDPFILQRLADFHTTLTNLMNIITDYSQHLDPIRLKQQLREMLAIRAMSIANTPLCYTLAPLSVTNEICVLIAKYCDEAHYCHLLLPTVNEEDIYGNNINEMGLGNFILTDNKKQFISLESAVATAFGRMDELEKDLFLTTDENDEQRSLTVNELNRLGTICSKVREVYNKMHERSFFDWLLKSNQYQLYNELEKLRAGLRKGDVRHKGQELNAGDDANTAIVNFNLYYNKLPEKKRNEINAIGHGDENLGEIFNLLFRNPEHAKDNNGMSVNYCIAIIGNKLDTSLKNNYKQIIGFTLSHEELVESLKQQLLEDIKNRNNIQLGYGNTQTLETQLQGLITAVRYSLTHDQTNYAVCLKLFAEFVAGEIAARIKTKTVDVKCDYYIKLLSIISLESLSAAWQTHEDRNRMIMQLFERINIVNSSSSVRIHIKLPLSVTRWNAFLDTHDILSHFPFIHERNPSVTYIGKVSFPEYLLKLPDTYITFIKKIEQDKDHAEWAERNPVRALALNYNNKVTHFVHKNSHGLLHNPYQFFNANKEKIAIAASLIVGSLVVLKLL